MSAVATAVCAALDPKGPEETDRCKVESKGDTTFASSRNAALFILLLPASASSTIRDAVACRLHTHLCLQLASCKSKQNTGRLISVINETLCKTARCIHHLMGELLTCAPDSVCASAILSTNSLCAQISTVPQVLLVISARHA